MNIINITSKLILIIATAFVLCGCGRSDGCLEADDFGFAKIAVSSRYDESEIFGDRTAEITPWIDGGLILDGNPLYIEVKNYDGNPNDNVPGILSAWCPWYGDKDHASTLTDFCARLNPCVITSLCPTPPAVSLPITNAPCLMTKGIGLYALLTTSTPNRYDPNLSIDTMSNPDPAQSVSLHMGNPHADYTILSINNDGQVADAGGVLYNYDNVSNVGSYHGGKLYFKILDSFYQDNNGQYRVFIKSGVQNGGWDPISWCIGLVKTALFGNAGGTGSDYATGGDGIIPAIYAAVVANSSFVSTVQALLTLYIIFTAIGFLMGSIELTQKELVERLFKVTIITILISPNSWSFFNRHVFLWFYEGTGFVIGILYEVAASGPGSTNPLDFFFSEEIFIKLFSLLFATPTGWIFIIIYILMLIFLVRIYFDAAVLYMTSLIMVGVLICIAPIFIALFLFEQTKSYFDNWLKQIMAYSIQMILVYAGILFMTMIIRNQVYNTLGFATCSLSFPNIGGITIFEWYFPKILSWSSRPELVNIPIPKDHFESAEAVEAQSAAAQVATATAALAQANSNQVAVSQVVAAQSILAQAQANQVAASQNVTYAQAVANNNLAQAALASAEAKVVSDNAALAQTKADQIAVSEVTIDLNNFSAAHATETLAALTTAVTTAQGIVIQYIAAQIATASGASADAAALVVADKAALSKAQIALGTSDTQANRDAITVAQTTLNNDTVAATAALSNYNALSAQSREYNALTAQITIDFSAVSDAQSIGAKAQIAAAQSTLVADIASQQIYSTSIMTQAVVNAQATLTADMYIESNANTSAAITQAQVNATSSTADVAANKTAQAQAAAQVAQATAALTQAQTNIAASSESAAQVQAQDAINVAAAQEALSNAQALQVSVNQSAGTSAGAALGGFGFSSSTTPSAQNNTFCLAYECTGERYADLPFLDPYDPYESMLINQMRNGQIGNFGSIAIIMVCVYLMDHFNITTVSMSKFLANTQGNMGDSSKAASTLSAGLQSMAMAPVHMVDRKLGVSSTIAQAKYNLIDKPWVDYKDASRRADAVNGGLKNVRKAAEQATGMPHAEATAFNKNFKNGNYHDNLGNLLKAPDGVGMNSADAQRASGNILAQLNKGKAGNFHDIAAAELFAKDSKYANLKGKIDYSKLSPEDALKVTNLSDNLKTMLDAKTKQDKFADAYVASYKKMSADGVGVLRKGSSVASATYNATNAVYNAFDTKNWDEASLERGRSIAGHKKDFTDNFVPDALKQVDYKKLYADRAKAETEKLSNNSMVDRAGPGGQGASHSEPFKQQLDKVAQLTTLEKARMLESLKKQDFTEEQLSHMKLLSVDRSGPGGQGVSHNEPFATQLGALKINGTALTSRQQEQIYKEFEAKGFTAAQMDSMKIVTPGVSIHEDGQISALSEVTKLGIIPGGVQVQGTMCIQIEMGPKISGTMSIQVGSGMHVVDATQSAGGVVDSRTKLERMKDDMKDLLDDPKSSVATKKPTLSLSGRGGGGAEGSASDVAPVDTKDTSVRGAVKPGDKGGASGSGEASTRQSTKRTGTANDSDV